MISPHPLNNIAARFGFEEQYNSSGADEYK